MSVLDKIRHARNQAKERQRIAAKIKEAEAKRVSGELVVENKSNSGMLSMAAFEEMAYKEIGISREVSQENVRQACISMSQLIHKQGNGMSKKQVMIHLPGEMRSVLQGRTSQEAYDFYWSLPEFRKVWGELGFTEVIMKGYVNTEAVCLGRTDLLVV